MTKKKGSSMLEVVFSIGVIALILSGVVVLMVYSVAQRTGSSERKRATQLAEAVIEQLVGEKEQDPAEFWKLEDVSEEELDGYDGYVYSVGFTNITFNDYCADLGGTSCVDAVVKVNWGDGEELEFRRFFNRR